MSDRGILLLAYNNGAIDYIKLAVMAAKSAKRYMTNNNITLITDSASAATLELSEIFDNIIIDDTEQERNIRPNKDGPSNRFSTQFNNTTKHDIYRLSPYKQTLMIDVDYFIGNNNLDIIFDTASPLAMYKNAISVRNELPHLFEQKLNPDGIDMWWSTVVYWDRDSEEAELFFGIWQHVKENYEYYKWLYKFPGTLFRTDYAVSIAAHLLNGQTKGTVIDQLPGKVMRFSDQLDNIVKVHGAGDYVFLSPDPRDPEKSICSRITNENIHIMNKLSILRHEKEFNEIL